MKDNKDGTRNNKTCNCLQSSVVYQATVTRNDNNTSEPYIGLTETDFKTRHRNHIASFRHAKHKNSSVNSSTTTMTILFHGLTSSSHYSCSKKRWKLCLKKKFLIICRPDLSSLKLISVTNSYLLSDTETKHCYTTAEPLSF